MTIVIGSLVIFLTFAAAYAYRHGARHLVTGVAQTDYSGYPDCRPDYVAAFESMANLATKLCIEGHRRLRIHAPLINLSKVETIRQGLALGVDYRLTHSCYDPTPEGLACGRCDSCQLRLKGFSEAGSADPVEYAIEV